MKLTADLGPKTEKWNQTLNYLTETISKIIIEHFGLFLRPLSNGRLWDSADSFLGNRKVCQEHATFMAGKIFPIKYLLRKFSL